jgi:hypothetical protein
MDFSNLGDDQLLQLIQAAMAETKHRGKAMIYAANRTVDDVAQELRTEAAKAAATGQTARASTIDNLAADKAALIQALLEADWFVPYRQDQFSINIWEKRGEVRIYLQKSFSTSWEFTYFHTGNPWNYKGTIKSEDPLIAERLIPFCQAICNRHLPGFKCYSNDYKKATPDPQALAFYRQAINKIKISI